uniref:ubiquitinyl hydrolase 1 n=1 Tax=Cacopsylla melanoneura TaxID=428564 RepID=A0A8D8RYT1_9HEMI
MDLIFHERQEGFLCAQHCLNALLQGSYFTPVDLASLGQRMDDEERMRMAECGEESEEYQTFIKQPSGNMDDSGFFSVQVISSALEVWSLELVPYFSSDPKAIEARKCPEQMQAYICNFKQHWLTIRKLGNQWFNLNSLLTGPELLSNTYLGLFLAQLQNDGYSIFIVTGNLPFCEADKVLKETPAVQLEKPKLINTTSGASRPRSGSVQKQNISVRNSMNSDEEADIQRALNLSLGLDEYGNPLVSADTGSSSSSDRVVTSVSSSETSTTSSTRIIPVVLETSSQSRNNTSEPPLKSEPTTRIIPITLETESVPISEHDFRRENSMDELQNAIKLSMEPFLTEQGPSNSLDQNHSANSQ